jgi:hypothetical protein
MTIQEFNNCVDNYSDGVYRFIVKNIGHEADAQGEWSIRFLNTFFIVKSLY